MLTIFTVPKPFAGHIGVIQRNAIRSWRRLEPAGQVILCGAEPDVRPAAEELGVQWSADVCCNRFGTPLLDSVFHRAAMLAEHSLLCYVNADIILLPDFLDAVRRVRLDAFLLVGQRWDVDLPFPWDFDEQHWELKLRRHVARCGKLHRPAGSDYFVFPRDCGLEALPAFAVGRQGWDNWMIANARQRGVPVVDTTFCTTVIHQNHDYAHVPLGDGQSYAGVESAENARLLGPNFIPCNLAFVTHLLLPIGLRPRPRRRYLLKRLRQWYERGGPLRRPLLPWSRLQRFAEELLVYRHLAAERSPLARG
ncbi:MAG: hypothetical protein JNM56_34990 [Planctomycetia bacterium]|nr:hypothetical protein [Planctomycetia bacterium]